jgi:nucleoside-diphosphate-sugar epimerase
LLIGGTGPTGPYLLTGLEERGYDVTILHTGRHELEEVAHVPHIHASPHDHDEVAAALHNLSFDVVVVTYGRLRVLAELLQGRVGKFVSIGGVPAYRGYFDPHRFDPPGLPVPTLEGAPTANEDDDGKSYRVRRTEEMLFELQPAATHFRYPAVYGPRQIVPRDWCIVRRILDRRDFIVLPDAGLTLLTQGYVENLAHAVTLCLDTDAGDGEIFNVGDEECLSLRQIVELIGAELGYTPEIIDMPAALAIPARPLLGAATTTHRMMGIEKVRALLGYQDVVPARIAIGRAARWLAENPFEPGGAEELVLQDPFDYPAEDALVSSWRRQIGGLETPEFTTEPGYGSTYSGPGASRPRSDERI